MMPIAMPDPARAKLLDALANIRQDFLDGLFPLINELDYQKPRLRDPAQSRAALETVKAIAHKLSGLAGSVGFPDLGSCAAEIDMAVSGLRDKPVTQSDIDVLDGQLEDLLDLMEAALDQAI